jgi:hypothetical protein
MKLGVFTRKNLLQQDGRSVLTLAQSSLTDTPSCEEQSVRAGAGIDTCEWLNQPSTIPHTRLVFRKRFAHPGKTYWRTTLAVEKRNVNAEMIFVNGVRQPPRLRHAHRVPTGRTRQLSGRTRDIRTPCLVAHRVRRWARISPSTSSPVLMPPPGVAGSSCRCTGGPAGVDGLDKIPEVSAPRDDGCPAISERSLSDV